MDARETPHDTIDLMDLSPPFDTPERIMRFANYMAGLRMYLPLKTDRARKSGRHVATMANIYALLPKPIELPMQPDMLWLGIWTGSVDCFQAIRDCWNAGLRNLHLQPPQTWVPYQAPVSRGETVH